MSQNSKKWTNMTIDYQMELRENVLRAYATNTNLEIELTKSKGSSLYVELREDIFDVAKANISEGTLVKFFMKDDNRTFRLSSIKILLKYIAEITKKHPEGLKKISFETSIERIRKDKRSEQVNITYGTEDQIEIVKHPYNWNILFDPNKFNILILPFYNPEDHSYISPVGNNLKLRLKEQNNLDQLGLDIEFLPYNDFDYTSLMAKLIGKEIPNVNMVIWGRDSKPKDDDHVIRFYYLDPLEDSDEYIIRQGRTEKIAVPRLFEITEGEIHLEIEDVIFWFLANKFYMEGKFREMLNILKKIRFEKYHNENLYILLATSYHFQNLFEKSKEFFLKALKINPKNPRGNNNYGILLRNEGHYQESIKYFKKAIKSNPKFVPGYLNCANAFKSLSNYKEADIYYKKAINIYPDEPYIYYIYANFLHYTVNKTNEAKFQYEKAIEIDSENIDFLRDYAFLLYSKLGQFEESKKYFEMAIKLEKCDGQTYLKYSISLKDSCKALAKEFYIKAIQLDPTLKRKNLEKLFRSG